MRGGEETVEIDRTESRIVVSPFYHLAEAKTTAARWVLTVVMVAIGRGATVIVVVSVPFRSRSAPAGRVYLK